MMFFGHHGPQKLQSFSELGILAVGNSFFTSAKCVSSLFHSLAVL